MFSHIVYADIKLAMTMLEKSLFFLYSHKWLSSMQRFKCRSRSKEFQETFLNRYYFKPYLLTTDIIKTLNKKTASIHCELLMAAFLATFI